MPAEFPNSFIHHLIRQVSDPAWVIAMEQEAIVYFNDAATPLFPGAESSTTESTSAYPLNRWLEQIDPADRDILTANLKRTGVPPSFEQTICIATRDTEKCRLSISFNAFQEEGENAPVFVTAVARPLPASVATGHTLADAPAIYQSLIEALPIHVFRKDQAGKFVFGNQRFCDALNLTLEELTNKTDTDVFGNQLAAKFAGDDQTVLHTGKPFHTIEKSVSADGSETFIEVFKAPVKDAHGNVVGIDGIYWDVAAQQQIKQQLVNTKEMAERANSAKSEFLASLSHEIRTSMHGILGVSDLLLNSIRDRKQRQYVEMISDSGTSLLTLVDDLLDVSKLESGRTKLFAEPLCVGQIVSDVVQLLRIKAEEKKLNIAMHVSTDVPPNLIGDAGRLRQVLIALVDNAIEYTHSGGVQVSVVPVEQDGQKIALSFSINDTGIGIAPDDLKTISSRLEQADSSANRQYSGTGIGLSVSSHLVKLMGGEIDVSSTPDLGSCFAFTLDFGKTEAGQSSYQNEKGKLLHQRALVVSSDPSTSQSIGTLLDDLGIRRSASSTIKKAIKKIKGYLAAGEPITVLFTDMQLEDGLSTDLEQQVASTYQQDALKLIHLQRDEVRPEGIGPTEWLLNLPTTETDLKNVLLDALDFPGDGTAEHGGRLRHTTDSRKQESGKILRILLAEDNLINQKLATALLEKDGHAVTVAQNGQQAVDQYATSEFDLVLMDVQMPILDGISATKQIRSFEQASRFRVPIIAITAHAGPSDRTRCLAAGMDEFLAKPLRREALQEVIRLQTRTTRLTNGPTTERPFINWQHAFQSVGGDEKLLKLLAKVFLSEQPRMLGKIESALNDLDGSKLQQAAHSLKGAACHLGALAVSKIAGELETIGQGQQIAPEVAGALAEKLRTALLDSCTELRTYLS